MSLTKKHFTWGANYIVDVFTEDKELYDEQGIEGFGEIKDYKDHASYWALRGLFEKFGDNFNVDRFNTYIETKLK